MTQPDENRLTPSPTGAALADPADLHALTEALRGAGRAANRAAAHHVFADFRGRKAANTIRRHDADLRDFEDFLRGVLAAGKTGADLPPDSLRADPRFWRGVTWGLVKVYLQHMVNAGYTTSTINFRLSTIKTYARLAAQAGELPDTELALIQTVKGYRRSEGIRLDEKRATTRLGRKKAQPVPLTDALAEALIDQPTDTPQGRRDQLLMCLLLRHGLRASELVLLLAEGFDLEAGTFQFYRPKVTLTQTHQMTDDTLAAARAFFYSGDAPTAGPLFCESNRNKQLDDARRGRVAITTDGVNNRVRVLGEVIGLDGLSPHDCRHYWATSAARAGTPIDDLMQAGGWSSVHMPMRYINQRKIANAGVKGKKKKKDD
jgi:integrase